MKIIIFLLALSQLTVSVFGQGRIVLQNSSSAPVLHQLNGQPVTVADGIVAALYYAPDGVVDPDRFVQVGVAAAVGVPVPGRFTGATIGTPATSETGGFAMLQVRIWELAYGATYEQAISAPPLNGREALVASSSIMRVKAALDAQQIPTFLPLTNALYVSLGPPTVSVDDLVVAEGPAGTATARFSVRLSRTAAATIAVSYATVDGTAVAGSDYVATNGVVTFAPGELRKTVSVALTPDGPIEPDEFFYLDLGSSPVSIERDRGTATITQAHISGVSVDTLVSFNTLPGQVYKVEYSSGLNEWAPVLGAQNVAGSGGVVSVLDFGSGCDPMRRYRIQAAP